LFGRSGPEEKDVSSIEQMRALTPAETEVLWCLFANGPTEDGNMPSQGGRDQLLEKNLIDRADGWQWLTREGVMLALGLGMDHQKDNWRRERG
jgi:hypothetical protein